MSVNRNRYGRLFAATVAAGALLLGGCSSDDSSDVKRVESDGSKAGGDVRSLVEAGMEDSQFGSIFTKASYDCMVDDLTERFSEAEAKEFAETSDPSEEMLARFDEALEACDAFGEIKGALAGVVLDNLGPEVEDVIGSIDEASAQCIADALFGDVSSMTELMAAAAELETLSDDEAGAVMIGCLGDEAIGEVLLGSIIEKGIPEDVAECAIGLLSTQEGYTLTELFLAVAEDDPGATAELEAALTACA